MSTWATIRSLSGAERQLLAEAIQLRLIVWIGLNVFRFNALRAYLQRRPVSHHQRIDRVAWAVKAVSHRWPGTTCLAEALVVEAMLRRHGHAPVLKIGVKHPQALERKRSLEAHAWVECEGVVVMGEAPEMADYAVLS
jgi:hypothetical protein